MNTYMDIKKNQFAIKNNNRIVCTTLNTCVMQSGMKYSAVTRLRGIVQYLAIKLFETFAVKIACPMYLQYLPIKMRMY